MRSPLLLLLCGLLSGFALASAWRAAEPLVLRVQFAESDQTPAAVLAAVSAEANRPSAAVPSTRPAATDAGKQQKVVAALELLIRPAEPFWVRASVGRDTLLVRGALGPVNGDRYSLKLTVDRTSSPAEPLARPNAAPAISTQRITTNLALPLGRELTAGAWLHGTGSLVCKTQLVAALDFVLDKPISLIRRKEGGGGLVLRNGAGEPWMEIEEVSFSSPKPGEVTGTMSYYPYYRAGVVSVVALIFFDADGKLIAHADVQCPSESGKHSLGYPLYVRQTVHVHVRHAAEQSIARFGILLTHETQEGPDRNLVQ